MDKDQRIYKMPFASVYPLYITKVERKGRTKAEVDRVINWLTGYSEAELKNIVDEEIDFETFFAHAPKLNPKRELITGTICGVKLGEMPPSTMKEIRYLDKLVDELARGKAIEKVLRN